jgi:hypothetical protein
VTCEAARAAGQKAAEQAYAKPEQKTYFTAGVSMEGRLAKKVHCTKCFDLFAKLQIKECINYGNKELQAYDKRPPWHDCYGLFRSVKGCSMQVSA